VTPGVERVSKQDPSPASFGLKCFLICVTLPDGTEHRLSAWADKRTSVENYIREHYIGATWQIL